MAKYHKQSDKAHGPLCFYLINVTELYEVGKIEGVEEDEEIDREERKPDPNDPSFVVNTAAVSSVKATPQSPAGKGREPKTLSTTTQLQNYLANLGLPGTVLRVMNLINKRFEMEYM